MPVRIDVLVACTLSLILGCTAIGHITISATGRDYRPCLESNLTSTTPCKTLAYVLHHASLNSTEIVLQGDHHLNHTLIVKHVDGITIRSSGNRTSTINCRLPSTNNDTGSGVVFEFVSNLTIINVIFEKCGTLQRGKNHVNGTVLNRSALYIINSTNIHFIKSTFHRNVGRGLSMHNVYGHVKIYQCHFVENEILNDEKYVIIGGGGILLELTTCSAVKNGICNHGGNKYEIEECFFQSNKATDNVLLSHTFQILPLAYYRYKQSGRGGGIVIILSGDTTCNSITIANCIFHKNSAQHGGAVYLILQDYVSENTITISGCAFTENYVQERGGGALTIIDKVQPNVSGNNIRVQNANFSRNRAQWGGAVSVVVGKIDIYDGNHSLTFSNCMFIENSAVVGAAIVVKPHALYLFLDGLFLIPVLFNCYFIKNRVIESDVFLRTSLSNSSSSHEVEVGVVDIAYMKIVISS